MHLALFQIQATLPEWLTNREFSKKTKNIVLILPAKEECGITFRK